MDRGFNKPQHKREVRGLLRGLGALFFIFGLVVGCGERSPQQAVAVTDKSSHAVVGQKTNPAWLSSCHSCAGIHKPLTVIRQLSAVANDNHLKMSFALVIDSSAPNFDFTDAKIATQYYGRAALVGRWRIAQSMETTLCGAPVGEYIVRPLTPSYMTAGAVSGGTFEAVGPIRIVFRLQSSVLTNSTEPVSAGSGNNRLSLNAIVDSVNNHPCNQNLLGN